MGGNTNGTKRGWTVAAIIGAITLCVGLVTASVKVGMGQGAIRTQTVKHTEEIKGLRECMKDLEKETKEGIKELRVEQKAIRHDVHESKLEIIQKIAEIPR